MQLDAIISALETARRLPREALSAGVAQADALAPHVIRCMEQVAAGTVLLPRQESLLFYGLHILAATRHGAAFAPLLAMLRADPALLDRVFGDALTESMPGIAISLYDGNQTALRGFIADPLVSGGERWTMMKVLAWLAWRGQVPQDTTLAFLRRLDAEDPTPPDDEFWLGWSEVMTLLGQTGAEDRIVARARDADPLMRQVDLDDIRDRLANAAARPDDGARFVAESLTLIDDPAATLSWVQADPPLIRGALDPAALAWLDFFLDSDEAPSRAMTPEELEGFMTALATLPAPVPAASYLPIVWGEPDPPIEGVEKRAFIDDILAGYPAAMQRELAASHPFQARLAGINHHGPDDQAFGEEWATGFQRGMAFDRDGWNRLAAHPVNGPATDAIIRYGEGRPDPDAPQSVGVRRIKTARLLGDAARTAYRFFRNLPIAAPIGALRTPKIGRNDPCPCGSGKKYKKCCGAAA